MAWHEFYIGSVGPLLYDDTDVYVGTLQTHEGLFSATGGYEVSTGRVNSAPVIGVDVLRLDDMPWPLTPTFADVTGVRAIGGVYQNVNGTLLCCIISVRCSA